MYLQNTLTKTQGESSFSNDDAYAKVPSLVKLQNVILLKACGSKDQVWPRLYLTHWYLLKKY